MAATAQLLMKHSLSWLMQRSVRKRACGGWWGTFQSRIDGTVETGRHLWRSCCPVLLLNWGHLDLVAQDQALKYIQGVRTPTFWLPWAISASTESPSQWESVCRCWGNLLCFTMCWALSMCFYPASMSDFLDISYMSYIFERRRTHDSFGYWCNLHF